jgi:CheY-like chemotaxis protein
MKKALLVDDDPAMNFVNKIQLQRTGIFNDIKIALNGRQALELIQQSITNSQELPDIIFLDLNMPVMGGFAFLEAFANLDFNNKDNIKIVILSSSDSQADKDKALGFGITAYYSKPIALESILDVLKSRDYMEEI